MKFPHRYDAAEAERRWQERWASDRIYEFAADDARPIFAIDTPPPTVSGEIHIGHVYSYVQAEAMARFWRMQGHNVYYPFGFDDNGLPTERFVERRLGKRAREVGREAFIAACLEISREVEDRFEMFWQRLGMSVDWRLRYSTINPVARRVAQWSFIELYRKGLVYRAQAPNPWCVECQTAIAQAEMEDSERTAVFYTLAFRIGDASTDEATLPVATTRPELLPACVAVFVHPEDERFAYLIGRMASTPLFARKVPILADRAVDPRKGSGVVMCCTFGDATDVEWWRTHKLPAIGLVTRQGRLGPDGEPYTGLTLSQAREQILADLQTVTGERSGLLDAQTIQQSVRVHERCGTPLEILETNQWFIRLLDARAAFLEAGRRIAWHPAHMKTRYEHWVEHLNWDWCISRQRFYGVPFPAWHCQQCGSVVLAAEEQLPIDPTIAAPPGPCTCGGHNLHPDEDVMDTWATSSLSPQIAADMFGNPALYQRLVPMQLRPQAHDIIRTWAFYTIVKSHYHFATIPWETILISGHGLDPQGKSIHKSKGNAPIDATALIERYSADAVRYWACSGSVGSDQPVNEETMRQGSRLVTKLWNAARFVAGHIAADGVVAQPAPAVVELLPADRALLSWLQRLVGKVTTSMRQYAYADAKEATERFFWGTFCDNYLEWVKVRLYEASGIERQAAQYTLYQTLLTIIKLLAPFMPHITEEIYAHLFAQHEGARSLHSTEWPQIDTRLLDEQAERVGEALLSLTAAVRRFKSTHQLGLSSELAQLSVAVDDPILRGYLEQSHLDLRSVTRARTLGFQDEHMGLVELGQGLWLGIL